MRFPLALAALLAVGLSAPAAVPPGTYFLWFAPAPAVQERLAIIKLDADAVSSVAAGPDRPKLTFGKPSTEAGRVRFPVTLGTTALQFDGAVDPADPNQVLGAFWDADGAFRGGLTRTDKAAFGPMDGDVSLTLPPAFAAADKLAEDARAARTKAARERDTAARGKLVAEATALQKTADDAAGAVYRAALKDAPGTTAAVEAAEGLLSRPGPLNVTPAEAAAALTILETDAKRYGPRFEAVAAVRLAGAVAQSDALAALALAAAKKAAAVPNLQTRNKFEALTLLAAAQEKAGQAADAAATRGEIAKVDAELDAEYRRAVPPFKPEAYPGRKNKAADRVAVVELFTGSQCPPCAGADAAFDALAARYTGRDVVLIQYHVHSPGPDALANPDTAARFASYARLFGEAFVGTPAPALDGRPGPGLGGKVADSKDGYDEYVRRIDARLEEPATAKVTGRAELSGDVMTASVEVNVKEPKDSVKLRLVVVENDVKYLGTNGVRLHRHVVRSMLGTAAGVGVSGLKDGKHTATANLKDVRAALAKYLADFDAEYGPFPTADRPLALVGLKVFALVQDDATGEILQAAELPLAGK